MKFLFLYVRTSDTAVPPFAPLYLGTVLHKAGIEVKIIDVFPSDTIDYRDIQNFSPDIVGFSVLTTNFKKVKETILELRQYMPKVKIVIGGIHPTVLSEECLFELNSDFVIAGEGEIAILKFCQSLNERPKSIPGVFIRDNDKVILPPSRYAERVDLDKLPMPEYKLLDIEKYLGYPGYIRGTLRNRIMIMNCGRGCSGNCTFCSSHQIYGRTVRKRKIDLLKEEIVFLTKNYYIKGFYFIDESLTMPKNWFYEFCMMLKEFNLPWGCSARISLIDKKILVLMRNAGCIHIDFGVESGSDKILKLARKGHTKKRSIEVFKNCEELGVRAMGSFIIGNIGETIEDAMETVQILDDLKPSFSLFTYLTPFPGTEVFKFALENNRINQKYYLEKTHDMLMEAYPYFNLSKMSNKNLVKIRALCQRKSFFRNYSSVITIGNIKLILWLFILILMRPKQLWQSMLESLKAKSADFVFFMVLRTLNEYERIRSYRKEIPKT